jgi:transposase
VRAYREKKTLRATERSEAQRFGWLAKVFCLDPNKLVFVDESGFHLAMTPSYARAPKGQRAYDQVPRNRGANTSFIAALSLNGLQAPMTLQGSVDGIAFETYVERVLLPTLTPGQIVVLGPSAARTQRNNHRIHKGAKVAELLASKSCSLLFLPPYSPDLNPIEEALSKVKTLVKASQARARDALDQAIAAALTTITLHDILGWFGHAGYNLRYQ